VHPRYLLIMLDEIDDWNDAWELAGVGVLDPVHRGMNHQLLRPY